MNVAIIGFGIEGRLNYEYWKRKGAAITVCDQNADIEVPADVQSQLGDGYLSDLGRFDVIVRSAGVNPDMIVAANSGIKHKITTAINEFLRVCPTKNVIGVTGTKGKGTTSTLITKMLEAAGKDVYLGGNIGVSPFEFLDKLISESFVVLELSSFQLTDVQHSPSTAVCLMVVPEHLNWHSDMDDYLRAKSQLFAHQKKSDTAIYFADDLTSHKIASHSPGRKIAYYAEPGAFVLDNKIIIDDEVVCEVGELRLLGKHNWQNACAAITTVWQFTHDLTAIKSILTTFSGLEHRLEFVRELDGVLYYDDSFGTTPETAIVALQAFEQPKVVILGGSDKGTEFEELAQVVVSDAVRHAIVIGDTAPKIERALLDAGFLAEDMTLGLTTMEEIVRTAKQYARSGEVVLLSTGCASFGLFKDYKDRGNQFKSVVGSL